jgi:lysophospholipase L1-like esterase
VLAIGTNNTGHKMQSTVEVAAGIEQILKSIEQRSAKTKVLLLGVFPRGEGPFDPGRLNNIAINQIIRRYDDGQRVHYLDVGGAFLEEDNTISKEIMPDFLHLSPAGYRRLAEAIEPKLVELGL